ncbi:uncharacterized protein RCC_05376 [Ramularia collo-cygni]|uniref:Extracellular mutant protein 11 C-terminal domain-containing protein n=1 Tax=Ramularia collo-cygni TaxID=112498 RepID=A0A2D3UYR1_9PEZI|nr:uncharacterized protein RCC_05376 [Ramularia collo-cygni]CZT19525.1 uncharacterized protein RCC_05376 [Ramularia collo-cygni]
MAREGMAGFVVGRHGQSIKPDPSYDDVKLPIKPVKSKKAGVGPSTRPESVPPIPPIQSLQDVPRTLYDTDASLDDTTTTAGTRVLEQPSGEESRPVKDEMPSDAQPNEALQGEGGELEYYTTDDEADEEHEGTVHPPQGAEARQKPDGRGLGRISGDTYPETTSGRPSTTNADDDREYQTSAYPQGLGAQSVVMPGHGAGTRLSHATHSKQVLPPGQSGHQDRAGPQQFHAPPGRPEDFVKDIGQGFTFARNESHPNRAHAAPMPHYHNHSTKPVPASTAQHGPSASGNGVPGRPARRHGPTQHIKPEPQPVAPAPVQQSTRKRLSEGALRNATPEPQQSQEPQPPQFQMQQQSRSRNVQVPQVQAFEPPENEMMSEVGEENNYNNIPPETPVEPQHGTREAAPLDHFPPQLYGMSFTVLKAAPFDVDPNAAEPTSLSTLQPHDPLPKRMDALFSMEDRAKEEYFTSLGIEEWEEAGDWFLDSFTKLTNRFKTARQEKRQIAREFENEVESRFESISKKRKLITGAMEEMKESGGKVLQGTPKKAPTQ